MFPLDIVRDGSRACNEGVHTAEKLRRERDKRKQQ